jgi:transcriptional regulator with XRE-family HTH domain
MSDFAERLQLAIKQAGLNPSKVAEAVNVTAQATQKWKKGQISVDTLTNVIKEIGVDANWLLLGEQANQNQVNNQLGYIGGSVNQSVVNNYASQLTGDDDWLTIINNDMFPAFAIGDCVRIDAKQEAQAGNYVYVDCEGKKMLRKYRPKGFDEHGTPYTHLVAENEDYPVIDSRHQAFTVLGVAVEYKRKLV